MVTRSPEERRALEELIDACTREENEHAMYLDRIRAIAAESNDAEFELSDNVNVNISALLQHIDEIRKAQFALLMIRLDPEARRFVCTATRVSEGKVDVDGYIRQFADVFHREPTDDEGEVLNTLAEHECDIRNIRETVQRLLEAENKKERG